MRNGIAKKCSGNPEQYIREMILRPAGTGMPQRLHQIIKNPLNQVFQKSFLAAKVIIHGRLRHPCGIHDLLDTHSIVSPCIKQIQCT